ncbi:hypothetical protein MMP16_27960, partial [Escherichia coli]|nr:hypothetical protein [Escherichia coli]
KVYGMGRDKSHEHWVSVIRQLIHLGLVTQNIAQHSALQLTEARRRRVVSSIKKCQDEDSVNVSPASQMYVDVISHRRHGAHCGA